MPLDEDNLKNNIICFRGHSITTWTGRGGEGGSQMSMIVHVRGRGGPLNAHMDKTIEKGTVFGAHFTK